MSFLSPPSGQFPRVRLRRTRYHEWSRRLVAEHALSTHDLVWPLFVKEGQGESVPITHMPGVFRYTIDTLIEKACQAYTHGIPAIMLFPCIEDSLKDVAATESYNPHNLVNRTVRALKDACPDLGIICDVALDPYTTSGHDGILCPKNRVDNDQTLPVLVQQALEQAHAGADAVAPSDMMDGRIGVVRDALDDAGFQNVLIISYAAKYASAFYGPFRNAIGSGSSLGGADKKHYQMDIANSDEARREIALDINEGADAIIIKPGMPYLDVITRTKETFAVPTWGFQVSGEYAMLEAAIEKGWIDRKNALIESLICFKRSGADAIITYYADDVARYLNERQ